MAMTGDPKKNRDMVAQWYYNKPYDKCSPFQQAWVGALVGGPTDQTEKELGHVDHDRE